MSAEQQRAAAEKDLLQAIRDRLPELRDLLARSSGHWSYEDPVYRLYHHSFKVYRVQVQTNEIVAALRSLSNRPLNPWFQAILEDGTGHEFDRSHNADWLKRARPMIEAFLHARFFLEMAVKYGEELSKPPQPLPSGWAALLHLFNLR